MLYNHKNQIKERSRLRQRRCRLRKAQVLLANAENQFSTSLKGFYAARNIPRGMWVRLNDFVRSEQARLFGNTAPDIFPANILTAPLWTTAGSDTAVRPIW